MKKITLILALIFGLFIFSSSKNFPSNQKSPKTRLDSLMSKKWQFDKNHEVAIFSKNTLTKEYRGSGKAKMVYNAYYLTDSIAKLEDEQKNFEWSKVGKTTKGRYLVMKLTENLGQKVDGELRMYRIVELSDKRLELEPVKSNGERHYINNHVYEAEPLDK